MAHGLSDSEMKKEYFDGQSDLNNKLNTLAQWIKESKHFIIFTGMLRIYWNVKTIYIIYIIITKVFLESYETVFSWVAVSRNQ